MWHASTNTSASCLYQLHSSICSKSTRKVYRTEPSPFLAPRFVKSSSWSPASAICQMSSTVSSVSSPQYFWDSCISVAGPTVRNSLPDHLCIPAVDSEQFRRDLKTYLFAGHSKRQRLRGVT